MLPHIIFWHWWIIALVLLGLELMAPGAFFLWIAMAAGVMGVIVFFVSSIPSLIQIVLFSVLALVSVWAWRMMTREKGAGAPESILNRRGANYVGRTFEVTEAIENGRGKVKIEDTIWKVEGEDAPVGSFVEVVSLEGSILRVKRKD